MKQGKLVMRQIKEIIRLYEAGQPKATIERVTKVTRKTVGIYIKKITELGLSYEKIKEMSSSEVTRLLFPSGEPTNQKRVQPNWEYIYKELKKKNVTLLLLWEEFKALNPDCVSYPRFCTCFKEYKQTLKLSMRQDHKYGEKCFIDFGGMTMPITDRETGEVVPAQVFIAALGASNYTFAEAIESQAKEPWLRAHVDMFEYFGGVSEILVPDNVRSGVDKACRYEPQINQSYQDLAEHYGTTILPARARKPQDKAKVEVAVKIVQNYIEARLRNETFHSIPELNQRIRYWLEKLNSKPFQKLPGSRKEMFEKYEKPMLKPLPASRYEFYEWKKAKVHIDYHVELEGHYYSVPYQFVGKEVEICFNTKLIKILYDSRVIASHHREYRRGKHSTTVDHMPKGHQEHSSWNVERFINWAKSIGPSTALVIERLLSSSPNPEIHYRRCLGILRLSDKYGKQRLESACKRLLNYGLGANPYQSLKNILVKKLDQIVDKVIPEQTVLFHENIRGPEEFV